MKHKAFAAATLIAVSAALAAFAPLPMSAAAIGFGFGSNETVIHKTNPHWPVPGLMTANPCALIACTEI
jgi:hypothetical protein